VVVIELSEQTIIDQLIERLMRKYPAVPPDTVAAVVRGIHARFDGRPLSSETERVFENRQVRASRLVMVVIMARWTMASWWSGLVS
jgi:hypothetical protein